MRALVLRTLEFNFRIFTRHVRTENNGIADALSRQDWRRFEKLTKMKNMSPYPAQPPTELWPLEKIWVN